jgi:hypothetical protein
VIASLLVTAALASADVDEAVTWIGRLGAEAFDDRVAAYKALEQLGREALPALRAAADSDDPRIRSRVRALIDSIGRRVEVDRLSQPIMVRLDFHDRPLGEVVETLNDRHDLDLIVRLGPEPRRGMILVDPNQPGRQQELLDRKLTLEAVEPVPFWEAIDRLCAAGSLHYGASAYSAFGASQGALRLMADQTSRGPVSDSGPFRVQVVGIRSVSEINFVQGPAPARRKAQPAGAGDLTVNLAAIPEPGLVLHPDGPASLAEAVDDQGRSLLPDAAQPPGPQKQGVITITNLASIHVGLKLHAPDPPPTTIHRLRGRIPVLAVTRQANPIVIPLQKAGAEKVISSPEMNLVVDEVSLGTGPRSSVRLTIRPNRRDNFAGRGFDPRRPDFAAFSRDRILERLELRDARGRRLHFGTSASTRGADQMGFYDRYQLEVPSRFDDVPAGGAAKTSKAPIPSELRYYGLVQRAMEIPFDFRDIPLR